MRTTVNIDDDVLEIARDLAREKKCSLGSALSELVRRGYRRATIAVNERGMPVFRAPPDAKPITNEDVRRALEDWP